MNILIPSISSLNCSSSSPRLLTILSTLDSLPRVSNNEFISVPVCFISILIALIRDSLDTPLSEANFHSLFTTTCLFSFNAPIALADKWLSITC